MCLALLISAVACGPLSPVRDAGGDVDAGTIDAGTIDAGTADAGTVDAGVDAGEADAGPPDAGLCGGAFCPPERITGERIEPWDLAVDATNVYWLEWGFDVGGLDGQVMRQRKDTVCLKRDAGCADDLNMRYLGRHLVDTMTVANGELCWVEALESARDVVCQSLTTNGERYVARNQPYATAPYFVDGGLLWVNRYGSLPATGQVVGLPLDAPAGAIPTVLAAHRVVPNSVTALPGYVAWAESGPNIDAGVVLAVPLDGGVALRLGTGQRSPVSIITCGDAVYWADLNDGAIMRATMVAASAALVVGGQKRPFELVCDATHVYWLNEGVSATGADGSLWQARLDGSEAKVMVQGIPVAWALAADDTWLYYIAQGTVTRLEGAIWRIRKHP